MRRPFVLMAAILALAVTPLSLNMNPVDGFSLLPNSALAGKGGGGNGGGGGGNGGGGNGGGNAGGGNAGGGSTGGGSTGGGAAPGANTVTIEESQGGTEQGGAPNGPIYLAQFTTKISKRKPANMVSSLDNPNQPVSFFTQIEGMAGHSLAHVWLFRGEVKYQVSFDVRGDSWRFWSTQLLPAELAGDWTVQVIDDKGAVLKSQTLHYEPTG